MGIVCFLCNDFLESLWRSSQRRASSGEHSPPFAAPAFKRFEPFSHWMNVTRMWWAMIAQMLSRDIHQAYQYQALSGPPFVRKQFWTFRGTSQASIGRGRTIRKALEHDAIHYLTRSTTAYWYIEISQLLSTRLMSLVGGSKKGSRLPLWYRDLLRSLPSRGFL